MEVSAEAKRIMVVALGKLYSSRTQRGGLRLHRSLLLTLVMKSARDIYHAAQTPEDSVPPGCVGDEPTQPTAEPGPVHGGRSGGAQTELRHDAHTRPAAGNKENESPAAPQPQSRKRRGKAAAEPDFLPCKKARLEQGLSAQPLVLSSVLNCSSELGQTPLPLHRVVAVC
ncbi:immediate early response gene 2 protein [Halichoeres trimaculatus]|uniref:immediate early response gene 2 protein n=1 Tax=Halichoeres trimaculatus TaxID=147232 RepID=UPI003D9F2BC7